MRRVIDNAVASGRLPADAQSLVEIQAVPPSLAVRDQLQESHRHRIEHGAGILSPQTWSQLAGFDYDQEQTNIAAHANNANPMNSVPNQILRSRRVHPGGAVH